MSIYPQAAAVRGLDRPKITDDTITAKSVRIEEKARDLRNRVDEIASRILRPGPETPGNTPPQPSSSHTVFALESAEQCIEESLRITEAILGAI